MLQKTRGIALHSVKYGESSLIVHVFTEKYGRQSYILKGVFSKRSSIKANLFSPLNLLEMEVYYKETAELQKIKEVNNIPIFMSINTDPSKSAIAVFIAELLFRVQREEAPNQQLFDFLFNSIHLLDLETKRVADFHLVFMVQFSKYAGFFPTNNYSFEYPLFDLVNGKFVADSPSHDFIPKLESAVLSALLKSNYESVGKLEINHQTRVLLLEKLSTYYKLHIPGMGLLKSLHVLREVFNQ
jgi:DNA repair protein RecO (recombination protein O)